MFELWMLGHSSSIRVLVVDISHHTHSFRVLFLPLSNPMRLARIVWIEYNDNSTHTQKLIGNQLLSAQQLTETLERKVSLAAGIHKRRWWLIPALLRPIEILPASFRCDQKPVPVHRSWKASEFEQTVVSREILEHCMKVAREPTNYAMWIHLRI